MMNDVNRIDIFGLGGVSGGESDVIGYGRFDLQKSDYIRENQLLRHLRTVKGNQLDETVSSERILSAAPCIHGET